MNKIITALTIAPAADPTTATKPNIVYFLSADMETLFKINASGMRTI